MTVAAQVSLALLLCSMTVGSVRADTLRCGKELVASGGSEYDVLTACGEPDFRQQRIEVRTVQRWVSRPCTPQDTQTQCGQSVQESVQIVLDDWFYDFGPLAFVQRATFEQGRLISVTPGARGSKRRR